MITVIIPSFQRPLLLHKALQSIRSSSRHANEIIVMSPTRDEGYREACRAAGAMLVDDGSRVEGKRVKGLWQVLNAGIELASSPYVCWLNDDCTVLPEWDQHALDCFQNADCGLVTLRTRHADGGPEFIVIPTLYGIPCANYGVMRKSDGLRFDERFSWFHGDADIALQAEFLRKKRVYGTAEPCVVHEHIVDALRANNERDEATRRDWLYLNAKWKGYRKVGPFKVSGAVARSLNEGAFLLSRFGRLIEKIRA